MSVILLVDDDADNRAIYRTMLEHRGHTCHEAEDGSVGLSLAHELTPDLILLDISMPVMDGWQTILALKLSPLTMAIPVVALTAHALEAEEDATEAGFDEYIRKPAAPSSVADAVEEILARSR